MLENLVLHYTCFDLNNGWDDLLRLWPINCEGSPLKVLNNVVFASKIWLHYIKDPCQSRYSVIRNQVAFTNKLAFCLC